MAEDRQIVREIWEGRIPCKFVLAVQEVTSIEQPDAFYIILNRVGYITQISEKLERHFKEYAVQDDVDDVWFEYNGTPLRWNYPVGLLFDALAYNDPLPWCITVHLTRYPSEIMRCESWESIESHFIMCVKEADALKHRSQIMSNLQKSDYKKLWNGLLNNNFDQFWSVNRRLMDRINDESFKFIPFKIYDADLNVTIKLVSPITEQHTSVTLDDLLALTLPEMTLSDLSLKRVIVMIHGVEPPRDVNLQWLSENFSYPDNFLHIAVVPAPENPLEY